tara:strand:+ start:71 stop:238 length:168 start_codon:yes stop_codon:yes gene_type:complete
MLRITTSKKAKEKIATLEELLEWHERFQCKRGNFQAPETCALCSAWITALSIAKK